MRQDPYKVEALKFGLSEIVNDGNLSGEEKRRAFGILEDMTANTPRDDWANKLFAGVAYFLLGEKDRGIEIVQSNVDFGYGADVSEVLLNHLKAEELSPAMLPNFKEIIETKYKNEIERRRINFLASIKDSELQTALTEYFASCDVEAFAGFECLMQGKFQESKQYLSSIDEYCKGLYILGTMYAKGLEVVKDYKKASEYYYEAAMLGHLYSQCELGNLYYDGGPNLEQDYMKAYMWYQVMSISIRGKVVSRIDDIGLEYFGDFSIVTTETIVTLGYTVLGFFGVEKNIIAMARAKKETIEGAGLFNFAKGSAEERDKARQDAIKIIESIPERQKNWK